MLKHLNKRLILSIILFFVAISTITINDQLPRDQSKDQPSINENQSATKKEIAIVKNVIDGDTIELSDGRKLRYIGIDTPETKDPARPQECFGHEAYLKNKSLVEGKTITLEKDVNETDRYGRLLRYVYIDTVLINDLLVKEGYAQSISYPPDIKYQHVFDASEKVAQATQAGLWGTLCALNPSLPEILGESTAASPSASCQYSCQKPDRDCSDFASQAQAQDFFSCCGFDTNNDPMRLDNAKSTGNNVVCKSIR